jgi:hypothetical protein
MVDSQTPERCVLEGVPRIHFYEGGTFCPEDIRFPAALKACLEYLGDPIGCKHTSPPTRGLSACGYSYLVGTTGEAFALSWSPDWQFTNAIRSLAESTDGAPYRDALDSIGYGCELVRKEPGRDNEAVFRERIVASIAEKHHPVIAFGVAGPPEAALIAGYDAGGDVLIGWSFFQGDPQFAAGLEFEPSGYFRKRHWFDDAQGLVLIGDKREAPERAAPKLGDVYRQALRWNIEIARRPQVNDLASGFAAYTAWAEALADDDNFPAGDEPTLRSRHMLHEMAVSTVAENRWYGGQFLIEAAAHVHYSLVEDLFLAAGRLAGEHDLMWQVWDAAGGIGNPEAWARLAEPAVRRRIVPLILAAQDKDVDAVKHLEHALELG